MVRFLTLICFGWLCWFLIAPVTAENMRFERIGDKQGLSQMSVNAVLQDSEGFMWFGTQDGLNRYDGHRFRVYRYDRTKANSLSNSWVNALFEDRAGNMWVGTNNGVNLFDRAKDQFSRFIHVKDNPNSISGDTVFSIAQDHDGMMWFACLRGGLSRYNPVTNQFTRFYYDKDDPNSLANNNAVNLLVDSNNNVWVATFGGGLSLFDRQTEQFTRYVHDKDDNSSINSNRVVGLFEDRHRQLWVGTQQGLHRFYPESGLFERIDIQSTLRKTSSGVFVWGIFEDSEHNLWIASGNDGLFKFDSKRKKVSQYVHEQLNDYSISNNRVRTIVEDRSGILWFSTRTGGVNKYNPAINHFKHYKHIPDSSNSLLGNTVWALHKSRDGRLWVGGSYNGLSVINPNTGQIRHYRQSNQQGGFNVGEVLAITEDSQGVIWLGVKDVGLVSLEVNSGKFTIYKHNKDDPNSLTGHRRVGAIVEDKQHNLWIGTESGLNRLDKSRSTFTRYTHSEQDRHSISDNNVMSLLVGRSGDIWVGTQQYGLNRFNPQSGRFSRYLYDPNNINSLSDNVVLSLAQSDNGDVWIGTQQGINRLTPQTGEFLHLGRDQGLSNEHVFGLLADKSGFVWATTNDGLNRINLSSLKINSYKFNDGIAHKEFATGAYHIGFDEQILVGGLNGFNTFYPNDIVDDTTEPLMVFTDFLMNNLSVSPEFTQSPKPSGKSSRLNNDINHTNTINLKHTDSVFTIEFAALHFDDAKQNQYAYQLVGFDKDWVYTDALNRRATYTNLDAGKYVFKLKGANSDNVWSQLEREIAINIAPALWATWWAYGIYTLFISVMILTMHYLRYKRREAELNAVHVVEASEHQLSLALWGSGDQLWDWSRESCTLERRNCLPHFDFKASVPLAELADFVVDIHIDDRKAFLSALSAHFIDKIDHFECAYRLLDIHGNWRWVLDRGKVVGQDDIGPLRITGTLQDINEMRLAEERLHELNDTLEHKVAERTQALQDSLDKLKATQQQLIEAEKMASLGNLVAGVAHEVNTPLGNCITAVSLHLEHLNKLKQQFESGKITRKGLASYLTNSENTQQITEHNLQRAADLIRSFKKVSVDQTENRISTVKLYDYLQEVIRSVEPTLCQSKVNIVLDCDKRLKVTTYASVWWQIITNLIENSLAHGFVNFDEGICTIKVELSAKNITLRYHDNGVGLLTEGQHHIFEPFKTTARSRGHVGLGMHVVYNLVVQKLGGDIKLDIPKDGVFGVVINAPLLD